MTKEVLSNAEIDALLDIFDSQGIPDEFIEDLEDLDKVARGPGVVSSLDLLKPNRFTRDHIVVIERVNELVARKIGGVLSDRLRIEADCDCVAVEQLRFGTWINQLDQPVGLYVLQVEPLNYPAILTVSSELLYSGIDCILGGNGVIEKAPSELSEAEFAVLDAVIEPLLEVLASGLSEMAEVEFKVSGRHTNVAMAQVMQMQEVVLALHYQVASDLMGDIRLAIPFAALEAHLDKLSRSRYLPTAEHLGRFRQVLEVDVAKVPLDLAVELGRTQIRLLDLLGLEAGDIVSLETKPGELLDVPVQGKSKFAGQIGLQGNRMAVKIHKVLAESGG
ncbi:MAG: flagellar motor switch protein FliM [Planctomycetota bacterium]